MVIAKYLNDSVTPFHTGDTNVVSPHSYHTISQLLITPGYRQHITFLCMVSSSFI